MRLIAE